MNFSELKNKLFNFKNLSSEEAFILFASTYIDFGLNEVLSYSIVDRGAALLFSLVPIFISYSFCYPFLKLCKRVFFKI